MTDTSGKAIKAAMADIEAANKERGVPQRGGKRYTMVADRVEVFRRHFGADLSIVTTVMELATELPTGVNVVVRADIRNGDGIVATGHAAEVWGSSNVNRTSALENAETSAIGRALAALGLHGGEFASANELDAVERKGGGKVTDPQTGRQVNPSSSHQLRKGGPDGKGWWPEYEKAVRAAQTFDEFDAVEGRYAPDIAKWQDNPQFNAAYEELRAKELARINDGTEQAA